MISAKLNLRKEKGPKSKLRDHNPQPKPVWDNLALVWTNLPLLRSSPTVAVKPNSGGQAQQWRSSPTVAVKPNSGGGGYFFKFIL
jgi:hypothetical protein